MLAPSSTESRSRVTPAIAVAAAALAIAAGLYGSLHCLWAEPLPGIAGLLLGAAALSPLLSTSAGEPADTRLSRAPLWAALSVAAALLFFRCYRLNPPGLWGDDAINGLLAFDVLDGEIRSPFELVRHSHSFFHALTNYAIAAAFRLIGAGPTALRLPGIAAGIAAGLAVYAALLRLFGWRTALVAGLFFAASPLQISHSKTLIQEVLGLAFQCIGVACVLFGFAPVRAARSDGLGAAAPPDPAPVRAAPADGLGAAAPPDPAPVRAARSLVWMGAGGVALAATIYTYHSAKLAPLVALPFVLAQWRQLSSPERRALRVALAVFAICLLPALLSYAGDPGKLTGRFAGVSLLGELRAAASLHPLWESIWRTLAVFHYQQGPPRYHWFGIGNEPALDPIIAFLAVCGLALSLRRWRQPRHLLLLTWFAIGLIPGVFSTEAPRGYRVLLATPPLYAWAALPVVALWSAPGTARLRCAARALAVLLVAAALFVDFNYYFYRTYTHPDFRWMQGARQVAMAQALRRRGPGWRAYLLSPRFSAEYETMRFLARAWNLNFSDVRALADIAPLDDVPAAGVLFATNPGSHEAGSLLRRFYMDAIAQDIEDPAPRSWFFGGDWPYKPQVAHREPVATLIAVSRDELERARARRGPRWLPARAEYQLRDGAVILRREPPPFFNFFADTFAESFTARFTTAIFVPPPGGYALEVRGGESVEMRIDGVPLAPGQALKGGRHVIDLRLPHVARRLRLWVWWTPPGGAPTPVPADAWRPLGLRELPPP